jgi:hypothetical protein
LCRHDRVVCRNASRSGRVLPRADLARRGQRGVRDRGFVRSARRLSSELRITTLPGSWKHCLLESTSFFFSNLFSIVAASYLAPDIRREQVCYLKYAPREGSPIHC